MLTNEDTTKIALAITMILFITYIIFSIIYIFNNPCQPEIIEKETIRVIEIDKPLLICNKEIIYINNTSSNTNLSGG